MDLADHLPLSRRRPVDESSVSDDWSAAAAGVLRVFADLLEQGPEAPDEVREYARASIGRLGGDAGARSSDAESARAAADVLTASPRRVRVETLGECLADLVLAGRVAGVTVPVDPVAAGAAVLARALSGPVRVRGLVRGRTLVATDADWRLGSGPVLERSCAEFLVLLYRS